MILFLDDWNKYPNAIIDTKTKNESFIRLSALYRDMGIKNHTFLLALHNPELQGVDPFSNDLTIEQMMAIVLEAKNNFWYFVREIAKSPAGGIHGSPIKANRANISMYWLFFNHITNILVQPRQSGKSLSSNTLFVYLLNVLCQNTTILSITKDDSLRSETLSRMKNLDELYPHYLKQRSKNDVANTESMHVSSLKNQFICALSSASQANATKVGRGFTSPILYIDEIAFVPNLAIALPAAAAAGSAARTLAAELNQPYGNIYTTTAGKKDDPTGRYVYDMCTSAAVFTEKMFDTKDQSSLEEMVRLNSPKGQLRVYSNFTHRKLGLTDEWLRRTIEETGGTPDEINRDFFCVWTAGGMLSPISTELSEKIRASEIKDYRTETYGNYSYITRWYIGEDEVNKLHDESHFIMGIDSSDVAGNDELAITIRDVYTGGVIAAGNYNSTNLFTLTNWLATWFIRFTNLTLIIERRSTGSMILDQLIAILINKGINPFQRIFNKVVNFANEKPDDFSYMTTNMRYSPESTYLKFKKSFGFATSATGMTSRSELYGSTFQSACQLTGDRVYDPIIIDQLLSLVIRNGRIDHSEHGHDDAVISWLLSYWLMTRGMNLDYYGINSRKILVNNRNIVTGETDEEIYDSHEQNKYRQEVMDILDIMQNEKDPLVCMRYESRLKALSKKIILRDNEYFSLDELLSGLKNTKKLERTMRNITKY